MEAGQLVQDAYTLLDKAVEMDPDYYLPRLHRGILSVKVPEFLGNCVRIFRADQKQGIIAWKPYELELDAPLKSEETMGIEVVGHRHNSFGFINIPGTDEYNIAPLGLPEMPYLSCRKA